MSPLSYALDFILVMITVKLIGALVGRQPRPATKKTNSRSKSERGCHYMFEEWFKGSGE